MSVVIPVAVIAEVVNSVLVESAVNAEGAVAAVENVVDVLSVSAVASLMEMP